MVNLRTRVLRHAKAGYFLLFLNYDQDLVIFLHIYIFIREPIHKVFLVIQADVMIILNYTIVWIKKYQPKELSSSS